MTLNCFSFKINVMLWPCTRSYRSQDCLWYGDLILLEYLKGNRGVLNGHDDTAVVQVKNVMLLFKNLERSKERSAVPAIFQLQLWAKETWTDGSYISSECISFRTVCRESFNFTTGRGTRVETGGKRNEAREDVMYLSPRLPTVWSDVHFFLILHQLGAKVTWRKDGEVKISPGREPHIRQKKQIQRERRRQGEQVWGDYIVKNSEGAKNEDVL